MPAQPCWSLSRGRLRLGAVSEPTPAERLTWLFAAVTVAHAAAGLLVAFDLPGCNQDIKDLQARRNATEQLLLEHGDLCAHLAVDEVYEKAEALHTASHIWQSMRSTRKRKLCAELPLHHRSFDCKMFDDLA